MYAEVGLRHKTHLLDPVLGECSLWFIISCSSNVLNQTIYNQSQSNGCRDVQHTGLQSTQTRMASKVHKQGALDRHIFPSIPTSVAALHV